jgi:hypothetical protein
MTEGETMSATHEGIALRGRRVTGIEILVVIAALVVALLLGVVIGRKTAPSVTAYRPTQVLSTTGLDSPNGDVRRQVMEKMNSLPGSPVPIWLSSTRHSIGYRVMIARNRLRR